MLTRVCTAAPRMTKLVFGVAEKLRLIVTPGNVPTTSVRLLVCRIWISCGGRTAIDDSVALKRFPTLAEVRPMTRRFCKFATTSVIATLTLAPGATAISSACAP
jgi:hypothetical protein